MPFLVFRPVNLKNVGTPKAYYNRKSHTQGSAGLRPVLHRLAQSLQRLDFNNHSPAPKRQHLDGCLPAFEMFFFQYRRIEFSLAIRCTQVESLPKIRIQNGIALNIKQGNVHVFPVASGELSVVANFHRCDAAGGQSEDG